MTKDYSLKPWLDLVKKYRKPKLSKSVTQIINSFGPFLVLWVAAALAFPISFWYMLPFAVLAGVFTVRIFIIQHDCGHGSFLKNRKAQDMVGFACSIASFTPYHYWKMEHALHHAHSGDIDHRDIGEIYTATVEEYIHLSKWEKIQYRLFRNPLILFLVGPTLLFVVLQRMPKKRDWGNKKVWKSVLDTNITLLLAGFLLSLVFGWTTVLAVQLVITYTASTLGVWLFYVQHQFEDGYWQYKPEWNAVQSAIHGSSYFKLPKLLQWFSGNIGFHHIHHLSPQIPNYELERCHNENPIFEEECTTLTLKSCWQTMKLRLWDEDRKKLISLKDLKAEYKPRFEAVNKAMQKLSIKQQELVGEVTELRRKAEEHWKKNAHTEHEVRHHLVQDQLKSMRKMLKRRSVRKQEKLVAYQEEIQRIKQTLKQYLPRII